MFCRASRIKTHLANIEFDLEGTLMDFAMTDFGHSVFLIVCVLK